MYDTITLNGVEFPRPVSFKPQREDIYAAEITTFSGKTFKDRIGWKYSDLSLEWDFLPQSKVEALVNLSGAVNLTFDDATGSHTETVARSSIVAMRHRYQIEGVYYWKNVSVKLEFMDAH